MADINANYSLKGINAFKLDISATECVEINKIEDLGQIRKNHFVKVNNFIVLGEGTNTLFTKDFNGLVLKMNIVGVSKIKETKNNVILEIGAGESWIKLVEYAVKNNWGGLENLSYIPGKVGAAPVQNIAAYGQNFDEIFDSLRAFDIQTGKIKTFDKQSCKFGYRTSIFKLPEYKKYVIVSVRIRLRKNARINTEYHSRYESLLGELSSLAESPYTIQDVHKAVLSIRKRKLPDWKKVGTAGSFFINPVISKEKLRKIQTITPDVQYYPIDELTYPKSDDPKFKHSDYVKIAAGWLFEELGWRGKKIGDVGTSPNHALVVINYGGASPTNVVEFTNKMKNKFKERYGVTLKSEVNII